MKSGLIFFVCIILLGSLAQSAPAQKSVPCKPCKAKGYTKIPCEACFGEKKGPCSECVPDYMSAISKAQIKYLNELNDRPSPLATKYFSVPNTLSIFRGLPGKQPCAAACARVTGDAYKCKACKGAGHKKCIACKGRGRGPCGLCLGSGDKRLTCASCQGKGKLAALNAVAPETFKGCPWCHADGSYECPHCNEEGNITATCRDCQGRKKSICPDCNGLNKRGCSKCRGSGFQLSFKFITDNKCDECAGKGYLPKVCKRGWLPCTRCKKSGKAESFCRHCFGQRKLICHGCVNGQTLAWESRSKRWQAKGDLENARFLLRSAIDHKRDFVHRKTRYLRGRIRGLEDPKYQRMVDDKKKHAWAVKAAQDALSDYELQGPREIVRLEGMLEELNPKSNQGSTPTGSSE